MINKKLKLLFLMMITTILFTACSISIPGVAKKENETGNIDYNVIDISSKEFSELNNGDFKEWYEQNYKNGGIYTNWCR